MLAGQMAGAVAPLCGGARRRRSCANAPRFLLAFNPGAVVFLTDLNTERTAGNISCCPKQETLQLQVFLKLPGCPRGGVLRLPAAGAAP